MIDETLACDDGNSKLVEVVTVADIDAEKHVMAVDADLVIRLNFCSHFDNKVWFRFCS